MHTLGKVLMFFVIVGALAGTYLSARLLDTRAQWMKRIEEKSEQYQANALELADARRRAEERENEANRLQFAYGSYVMAPNSSIAQGNTVLLGSGSNAGLEMDDTVHLFVVNAQGASQYLGQFAIDGLQADRAGATLNRAPFPGETDNWINATYRVRTTIPAPWGEEFTTLWSQYGSILQMHDAELAMEARQQRALADATTQLDERMQELQGHPDAPEDAGIVERVGLVEAMRLAEISRDQVLAELDALRQEYSEKWHELQDVIASNTRRRQILDGIAVDSQPLPDAVGVND